MKKLGNLIQEGELWDSSKTILKHIQQQEIRTTQTKVTQDIWILNHSHKRDYQDQCLREIWKVVSLLIVRDQRVCYQE